MPSHEACGAFFEEKRTEEPEFATDESIQKRNINTKVLFSLTHKPMLTSSLPT